MTNDVGEIDADYLVFDCDGVILDSNAIKTAAFRYALSEEDPSQVEELVLYHLSHGGFDRREKLLYYYRDIAGRYMSEEVERSISKFSEYCRLQLTNATPIRGVREFLEQTQERPNFVVTGGNQSEVIEALRRLRLKRHFTLVLGSPRSKRENMTYLQETGSFVGDGVYFGDSQLDMDLASAFGQRFVFVAGVSDWSDGTEICTSLDHDIITDFRDVAFRR